MGMIKPGLYLPQQSLQGWCPGRAHWTQRPTVILINYINLTQQSLIESSLTTKTATVIDYICIKETLLKMSVFLFHFTNTIIRWNYLLFILGHLSFYCSTVSFLQHWFFETVCRAKYMGEDYPSWYILILYCILYIVRGSQESRCLPTAVSST